MGVGEEVSGISSGGQIYHGSASHGVYSHCFLDSVHESLSVSNHVFLVLGPAEELGVGLVCS